MNTPSHRQDLELGWLRLQRMLEGIEGMALLLCDHHLALANGAPSPLPEAQLERAEPVGTITYRIQPLAPDITPLATACAGTAQCRPTVGTHHLDAGHEKTRHKGGFLRGDQQSVRIT